MFKRHMMGLLAASFLVAWVVPEAEAIVIRRVNTVQSFHSCQQYLPESTTQLDPCFGATKVTDTLYGMDASTDEATCTMTGRVICNPLTTGEFCSDSDSDTIT